MMVAFNHGANLRQGRTHFVRPDFPALAEYVFATTACDVTVRNTVLTAIDTGLLVTVALVSPDPASPAAKLPLINFAM